MNTIESIAVELFNKIRSRFSNLKLGDDEGAITNEHDAARYFEFDFNSNGKNLGRVNIKLSDDTLIIIYPSSLMGTADTSSKEEWFSFMREMRQFARRNMLQFDSRDISKDNLDIRDYQNLVKNESIMETCAALTTREKLGRAKVIVKRNVDNKVSRINEIFIESPSGERFRYPHKTVSGARAIARHISNDGTTYDEIGKSIIEMSNELTALRRFKRKSSKVTNESMTALTATVEKRIDEVHKKLSSLKGQRGYLAYISGYTPYNQDSVPGEIADSWIGQLGDDSEKLRESFPFVYRAMRENSKVSFKKLAETLDIGLIKEEHMPSREDVNDLILSFYDRMTRTFPRGRENVLINVEKKFGKKAAKYASVVVDRLTKKL